MRARLVEASVGIDAAHAIGMWTRRELEVRGAIAQDAARTARGRKIDHECAAARAGAGDTHDRRRVRIVNHQRITRAGHEVEDTRTARDAADLRHRHCTRSGDSARDLRSRS